MGLRMMAYGDSNTAETANYVLGTDLIPPSRCISKSVAISSKASLEAMNEWEQTLMQYGNTFPYNRLVPAVAVVNKESYEGFAELFDDKVILAAWDRDFSSEEIGQGPSRDSYIAGYSYELVDITFNDDEYRALYDNSEMIIEDSTDAALGDCTQYTKGWALIKVRKASSPVDDYGDPWDNGYHHIPMITCSDIVNGESYTNVGYDRSVTLSFRATKLPDSAIPAGVKTVPAEKTHTEFLVIFYHRGLLDNNPTIWQLYPNTTNTLTLNHTGAIDLAVILEGSSTNGTYWDSTGWVHNAAQVSGFENAINITRSSTNSTLTIDWNIIRDVVSSEEGAANIPITVYGCWDLMHISDEENGHLVGDYYAETEITADGMDYHTVHVTSAGNLNKTEYSESIKRHYTPMYKIMWNNNPSDPYNNTIRIMPLEKYDIVSIHNIDGNIEMGTYGLIYPKTGFRRNSNVADTIRNYIGDNSIIQSGNRVSVEIVSDINEHLAPYIVLQYFPQSSLIVLETYIVNNKQLGPNDSITITPRSIESTLNIQFGDIPAGSARWLTIRQEGSNEYANLSFTFNK